MLADCVVDNTDRVLLDKVSEKPELGADVEICDCVVGSTAGEILLAESADMLLGDDDVVKMLVERFFCLAEAASATGAG